MFHHPARYHNIWRKLFKIHLPLFHPKGKQFFYRLSTDGYSASITLIDNDSARNNYRHGQGRFQNRKVQNDPVPQHLDELDEDRRNYYNNLIRDENFNVLGIDPGKKDIFAIVGAKYDVEEESIDNNTLINYTMSNAHRRSSTFVKRASEIQHARKTAANIFAVEDVLKEPIAGVSSSRRSLFYENFLNYMKRRSQVKQTLYEFYAKRCFRKNRHRIYLATQANNAEIIKQIKRRYGPNVILALGEYAIRAKKQMKGLMPSITKGKAIDLM
jgi:hypothetical protein